MQATSANEPNVTLPRAIVRRSAAIQARIDAKNTESKVNPVNPNTPPDTPNVPDSPNSDTPIPSADPPAAAADPRETDPAYWRQRFNVTAGVLKTERTARQEEASEFNRKLTEMQEQIRNLQAKSTPSESKMDLGQFFTPEQIEQFGEEQCEAMAKAATKSAHAAAQQVVEREITPIREQQEREKAQTVEERKRAFTDKLEEQIPNYAEIDVSEDWLSWLAQEDDATGLVRQNILDSHIRVLDAGKVARVFKEFLKSKTPKSQPPIVGKGNGAGPSGEAPPVAPTALKPPTDAETREFYKRAALGRVKDAERVDFEARMKLRAAAR